MEELDRRFRTRDQNGLHARPPDILAAADAPRTERPIKNSR